MVSGIIAAAIAVIGTLLGAVIAHRYQEKAAAHADRQRNRQLFLDACADFIGLAEDYRRAQYDRWTSRQTAAGSDSALAARAESYRLYVEVRSSAFRLGLVAVGTEARDLAEQAAQVLVKTREIFFAEDKADMLRRGNAAQQACEAFVARARDVLAHDSALPGRWRGR